MELGVVKIWTDGACSGNPGPGGWGALIRFGDKEEKELGGSASSTTNNRMELTAALEALRALENASSKVHLYTDSVYVQKGMTYWIKDWIVRGWRTKGRKAVKNQDLWEQLLRECKCHRVNWHWVKGHDRSLENNRVDALARSFITIPGVMP